MHNTSVFNTIGIISKCINHGFISRTSFDIRLLKLYFLLYVQSTAVSTAVTRLTAALPRGGRTRARLTLTRKGEVGETEERTLNNLATCSLRLGNSVTGESITYFDLNCFTYLNALCAFSHRPFISPRDTARGLEQFSNRRCTCSTAQLTRSHQP